MSNTPSPWVYSAYSPDTPAQEFEPFQDIVGLWRAKAPSDNQFPQWRDFNLMDFEGWWGQISLAEFQYEPHDFRWALWGTKLTEWWGADYTDKFISQIDAVDEVWENYERPYIQQILEKRLIGCVTGSLKPQGRDHKHICGIDLPLEIEGRVTHFMSAYKLIEQGETRMPSVPPLYLTGAKN